MRLIPNNFICYTPLISVEKRKSYCSTNDSKRSFLTNENLKSYPKSVVLTMKSLLMSSTKNSTPCFLQMLTNS